MRILLVQEDTDLKALAKTTLASRLSAAQSESALASLAAANPHADLAKVAAGTVLFVPDTPSFKATVGEGVNDDALAAFEKLVKAARTGIGDRLDRGAAVRRTERAAATAAIKLAVVQRLAKEDPDLKRQIDVATPALKKEQEDDTAAQKAFGEASDGIAGALDALRKLMG